MKNGKHTIIRLIRGQKNKRLTEREARLTLKMGVSGFQVFQVFKFKIRIMLLVLPI